MNLTLLSVIFRFNRNRDLTLLVINLRIENILQICQGYPHDVENLAHDHVHEHHHHHSIIDLAANLAASFKLNGIREIIYYKTVFDILT